MHTGRRLARLLVVAAIVAAPAVVLRVLCVGNACDEAAEPTGATSIPFCTLPADIRTLIDDGYRLGRSPDVFAVTEEPSVRGQVWDQPTGAATEWPSLESEGPTRVPIVIDTTAAGRKLEPGTGLAEVAPTLAAQIDLRWPFPELRDGTAIPGVHSKGPVRLLLIVAWKGIGSSDLEKAPRSWPFLKSLMREGSGTLDGRTGSLPVDSSASLSTVGTGGLPDTHGITGTVIRNDDGRLVQAFSARAPVTIIAGLGDTLDNELANEPLIGEVEIDPFDRGLIGGGWYQSPDDDSIAVAPSPKVPAAVERMLSRGFGADDTPDLLAVTLEGTPAAMDKSTRLIFEAAEESSKGFMATAVVGTGSATPAERAEITALEIAAWVNRTVGAEAVFAAVPGGLFLDQQVLAADSISDGRIVDALAAVQESGGEVFSDAFPAFAISFGRYC
ncbi:MAG: alkaline phosphatase family protein [Actinomycetota bacterium]